MDTDLFRRFSKANTNVKFINQPLAYFRLGGISQSDETARLKELMIILQKNGFNKIQRGIFLCLYKLRLFIKHTVMAIGVDDFRFKSQKKF